MSAVLSSSGLSELGEHAVAYARAGLEVFPLNADKTPATAHGMKDATSDPERVAAWWRSRPDALIGCRIPADVVVLDLDPRHGGLDTWAALEDTYGSATAEQSHASGRNDGGRHLWYRRPAGKLGARRLNEWARERAVGHATGTSSWVAGIDVLHHEHRYTILPPSPHAATGMPYRWLRQGQAAPMPSWLAELITIPPAPTPVDRGLRVVKDDDSIADWFSSSRSWHDIIGSNGAGWILVSGDGDSDGSAWRHPNTDAKHSATVRHACLFVFTTSTEFPTTEEGDPNGLTRFRAWAILEHGGDLSAAARAARELRDGPPAERVDPTSLIGDTLNGIAQTGEDDDARFSAEEPTSTPTSWEPVDLRAHLNGSVEKPTPTMLRRADGKALIYPGRVTTLMGESGSGKSWLGGVHLVAEVIRSGGSCWIIDYEDQPDGVIGRLRAVGLSDDEIADNVVYLQPEVAFGIDARIAMTEMLERRMPDVVVIDSTGEALAVQGANPNADDEVAAWFVALPRWLATRGPAVVNIDHIVKTEGDTPTLYPIGSQRKRAAVHALYRVDQVQPLGIGKTGILKITCGKDRAGTWSRGQVVAEVTITSDRSGETVDIAVNPPSGTDPSTGQFRPTTLMQRVSEFIEGCDSVSTAAIKTTVKGSRVAYVVDALNVLVDEGYVERITGGARGQVTYRSVRAYRELDEMTTHSGGNGRVDPSDGQPFPPFPPVPTHSRNGSGPSDDPFRVPTPYRGNGNGSRTDAPEAFEAAVPTPSDTRPIPTTRGGEEVDAEPDPLELL